MYVSDIIETVEVFGDVFVQIYRQGGMSHDNFGSEPV